MSKIIQKAMATFYDKQDKWLIDQMLQDMQDNPEKYKGAVVYPIEREKVIDLIKKGQNTEQFQTQKAIECLKKVIKKLYDEFESGTFITDEGKEYYGSYVKYCLILDFVIDKLKVLGLEGDDIFVDNILKELEEEK